MVELGLRNKEVMWMGLGAGALVVMVHSSPGPLVGWALHT